MCASPLCLCFGVYPTQGGWFNEVHHTVGTMTRNVFATEAEKHHANYTFLSACLNNGDIN